VGRNESSHSEYVDSVSWLGQNRNEEMSTRPVLSTLVRDSPQREVRHLLIHLEGGPSATSLSQLISGVETHVATGTEYEMHQGAEALVKKWNDEGFRLQRKNEPVFEPLKHTIALAMRMGYTTVYDDKYRNNNLTDPKKRNLLGVVPLTEWSGVLPKSGGDYADVMLSLQSIWREAHLRPVRHRGDAREILRD
jgi:hypothetical protein